MTAVVGGMGEGSVNAGREAAYSLDDGSVARGVVLVDPASGVPVGPGGASGASYTLLAAVIATGVGPAVQPMASSMAIAVTGAVSASTGAATVDIQVSNDGTNYMVIDTATLTLGTATTGDSVVLTAPWKYVRANVTAISGTNATLNASLAT